MWRREEEITAGKLNALEDRIEAIPNKFEVLTNKVDEISSLSTNEEYPTVSAVKRLVGGSSTSYTILETTFTENGTYDAGLHAAYNPVHVNVPSDAITESIEITSNGTYYPEEGVDGFDAVTVDVSGGK